MSKKTYRGALPKPDSQGRWRPVVGRSHNGKPQRFQIGNKKDASESVAKHRLDYIRDLYDRQCAELGIDFWARWTLPWAVRLASDYPIKVFASEYAKKNDGQAAEELSVIYQLQSWGVPIEIMDSGLLTSGNNFLRKQVEEAVNNAVGHVLLNLEKAWGKDTIKNIRRDTIPDDFSAVEAKTLYETFDIYIEHLQDTGKRDENGNLSTHIRNCQERLSYLKQHHDNCPLWQLNLPYVEKMVAYWRNRPETKKGKRCSWHHAHDMVKELFRFFSWLDKHPDYKWEKPKGMDDIPRSPIKMPEDKHREAFQTTHKKTYTPEQLAIITKNAGDFGKALIGVCVNCAFGASEVGQWNTSGFSLYKAHPHADKVGFKSTNADSWIVGPRPKTGVYGEHLLWPQVAKAVAPFLDGRQVLPMTSRNTPWYRTHSRNPQSTFNNWWTILIDRVEKKHQGFLRLPFGTLRDLLPDILRREFSDDVASICLQHKQISEDDLLKCYANVPFKKLFEATRQLEQMFRPFLDVLNG
ncbi:MAG: hypothetical protein ABSG67_19775 [Thermoguttaceae bacterium]